jgi:transposase InsO family protein
MLAEDAPWTVLDQPVDDEGVAPRSVEGRPSREESAMSTAASGVVLGTLQVELLDTKEWQTRDELANAIFEWTECWHNPHRRHSSTGMHSPVTFDTLHTGSDQDH